MTKSGRDGRGRHGRRRRRACGPTRCSPSAPGSRSTTGSSATRSSRRSAPGIFAAGDVCSYESVVHGRRLRVEHWDVALQQGRHAAGAMLGSTEPYREVPYFFSDLADWARLEYVGPADEWDEVVWRGDRRCGRVQRLVPRTAARSRGALAVGRSEDLVHARRLIETGADVSGAEGRAGGRGLRVGERRAARPREALCVVRGLRAHIAPWCNGSTPRLWTR